jgi:thioredoxin
MADKALVLEANDSTFTEIVKNNPLPVLVDFWAPWCGPCQRMGPIIEQLSEEFAGGVSFVKINIDEAQRVASSMGISAIPTIALFDHGEVIAQQVGVQPKALLKQMLEKCLQGRNDDPQECSK